MSTLHTIHPIAVKLESAMKLRLKELGRLKQRTVHWLMKAAILKYLECEEEKERLKQETISRWQKEALQNKTVKNKSVVKWLETWGTPHEVGRPPCEK